MVAKRVIKPIFEVRADRWQPATAALLAISVAIPVLWGTLGGNAHLGVLASIGALYAGLASFGNVHAVRLKRTFLTTLAVALLAVLGMFAGHQDWTAIVGVGVVAFVFAIYGATSSVNSIVGMLGTGIFIVLSAPVSSSTSPWVTFAAFLAGGFLQTAVVAIMGPFFPLVAERESVARAYESLANYVREAEATREVPIPSTIPFNDAHARLGEGIVHDEDDEHACLWHVLRVGETLRAAIVGFARAHIRLMEEGGHRAAQAHRTLNQLESDFNELADEFRRGHYGTSVSLANPSIAIGDEEYDRWIRLLSLSFQEVAREPAEADRVWTERYRPTRWRDSFLNLWASPTLRRVTLTHATRYSLVLAIGTAIYRLAHIPMGYWIPLTTTFLLRPDYSSTVVRGLSRFVGTFGGVVIATLLAIAVAHNPLALAILTILSGWAGFALYEVNFTLYVSSLTVYVILGLVTLGRAEVVVGEERIAATAAGGLLAVAITILWPAWESYKVRSVFQEAFQAQVTFGEALDQLTQVGDPEGGDTGEAAISKAEQLRHEARVLRAEAERLLEAAQVEPKWSRQVRPEDAQKWREDLDQNAAVLLSLHALALEQRAGRIPEVPQARAALQHAISCARTRAVDLEPLPESVTA